MPLTSTRALSSSSGGGRSKSRANGITVRRGPGLGLTTPYACPLTSISSNVAGRLINATLFFSLHRRAANIHGCGWCRVMAHAAIAARNGEPTQRLGSCSSRPEHREVSRNRTIRRRKKLKYRVRASAQSILDAILLNEPVVDRLPLMLRTEIEQCNLFPLQMAEEVGANIGAGQIIWI
jgi:hypothetical protein